MRHSFYSPILLAAGLLFLIWESPCQGQTGPDNNKTEQSIIGPWNPDSVTVLKNGAKKTMGIIPQKPFSVIITDKEMTMRVGDKKFAETSYILDSKQTPAAIDAKFEGQDMPGIWELNGNRLRMSLNEAKKGRPKEFGAADNDMDLVLHRYTGQPLFVIGADGSDLHQLPSMGEYLSCSSPKWSCDGKIAYNACRKVFGEDWYNSHIFVVDSDGSLPKDLGDGTNPSWSPDGKKIAYSRNSTGGVWMMDADGSNKKLIEERGWSVDWSPKNQDEVAYITSPGGPVDNVADGTSGNIAVRNLKTNVVRTLLDGQYSYIRWYMTWSPDGKWVCFLGELPYGSSELAIVSAEGQSKSFKVLLPNKAIEHVKEFTYYFSWRPDCKRLLISMVMDGDDNRQLYLLDVDGKESLQKLAGQDPSRNNILSCWSPDGKKIVFTSAPPKPVQNNVKAIVRYAAAAPYTANAKPADRSSAASGSGNTQQPLVLDISRYYHVQADNPADVLKAFFGRQVIDGLPFEVGGQALLYGQTVADRREMELPDTFKTIRIGRKFDELHLIHHTRWPDAEGQTMAYICLNYTDGTKCILPIRYGAQVRDWYRLPSEEKELLTDPNTKICWRRPPVQFKAPVRLFKSILTNPSPEKVVETMDVVSARNLASYSLIAATVANRDPARPITPPPADTEPERKFDGKMVIRVVDDVTGKPIEGALVDPGMNVDGEGVVASPFYTSSDGEGAIRYPVKLTTNISASVKKEGYLSKSDGWSSSGFLRSGNIPNSFTFRLSPLSPPPPPLPQITKKDLVGTWILAGTPDNVEEPPAAGGRLKFITDKHWTVTQADPDTGVVMFHHGGTYTLNGDEYVETVKYSTENNKDLISMVNKFKIKVEGDTLTIIGIGNPWNEVWKRAK